MLHLLLIFVLCQGSYSANILGVIPSNSYSHQIAFRSIWRELANRGHDVTLLTTHPENNISSPVNEIHLNYPPEIWNGFMEMMVINSDNGKALGNVIKKGSLFLSEVVLQQPEVEAIVNNRNSSFDLVIVEVFYEPLFALAEVFNCPLISVVSFDLTNDMHGNFESSTHPLVYQDIFSSGLDANSFWNRLQSLFFGQLFALGYHFDYQSNKLEKQILETYFGISSEIDLRSKISIVLANVIPALSARPIGPAVVNIGGGLHILPPRELPKELGDYLNDAKDGFVYISLGTNVHSSTIGSHVKNTILDTCAQLPYKCLWKLDVQLEDIPDNVKIVHWVPQQDVLRHPNIKVFVFQGGIQSTEEAILSHVPIVGIPFFSDQRSNMNKLINAGLGIQLNKDDLDLHSLKNAILEVIENPSYKQKCIELAVLIRDQPMSGVEKAVWWTEYILRHKGAPHLRPKVDIPFYQYYFLDVIGFLLSSIVVLGMTILKAATFIQCCLKFITNRCDRKSKLQ